ncbi:hypothetical protein MC885_014551 [Smutsia gigantea]|nr:hypothetical protein MC885_014551 [Smutsia gigantea]
MGTESAEEEDAPNGRLAPGVSLVADTSPLACVSLHSFGFPKGSSGTGREESFYQDTYWL